MTLMKIGICSWCMDRHDPMHAISLARDQLRFNCMQLGFFSRDMIKNADTNALLATAQKHHVTIVSTFVAFEREDYSSIETIAQTGGLMLDAEFESRRDMTNRVADISAALGCSLVAMHIGTVPSNTQSSEYEKLASRVGHMADDLKQRGQTLLMETGRESAKTLQKFLDHVKRDNLAINFDPGNFVIYGSDDPVSALVTLRDHIQGVHLKDGLSSTNPGQGFGKPASLGAGNANIPRLVNKLRWLDPSPPLLIECSGPYSTPKGIAEAADFLRSMIT